MIQVFSFIGVSSDEQEAMRKALREGSVDFYETPPANWGQGQPGLWVRRQEQAEKANRLLELAQEKWVKQTESSAKTVVRSPSAKRSVWLFVVFAVIVVFVGISMSAKI